jgi:hypothetical protein
VTTRRAECLGAVCQNQPVAGVKLGVGAEPVEVRVVGQRFPAITIGLERAHGAELRNIAQASAAAVARIVLEKERLPAMLTFEEFHSSSLRARICFNDTSPSRRRS